MAIATNRFGDQMSSVRGDARSRPRRIGLSLLAAVALVLSACGDGDDGQSSGSSELIGTWAATDGAFTWVVTEKTIEATAPAGEVLSEYTATETTLEIRDEAAANACPPDQIGTYEWSIDGETLSLSVVTDDCGRVNVLDGATLERQE